MKMKVSDYIAQFLVDSGITDAFTIVGGGAMHLNDSFGKQPGLKCYYNHHEQACAIAAESYARITNRLALVCVTTGPGGTNALTGVVGGWLDSIPMLVISGQVRYDTTARSTGLPLRAMGDQEFDICTAVQSMTKYCEMVIDPLRIKYCLKKALTLAVNGRPGPVWLDIPLNVQGAYIETDDLVDYDPQEYLSTLPRTIDDSTVRTVIEKIRSAERPVFYAGNGIRLSDSYDLFLKVIRKLNIPVVLNWNSTDILPDDHPLYAGRGGSMGTRAGNFAVQNSDLILSVGGRLSLRETSFNWKMWARHAYVIMEEIDEAEMKKPILHVDMPLLVDAKVLLEALDREISAPLSDKQGWIDQCRIWVEKYPVVQDIHYKDPELCNPYCFMKELSSRLPEGHIIVAGNGTASAVGAHAFIMKKGQRFIANSAIASMGYDIPAGIGACVANGCKDIVCMAGDGSIMMNLQELQTIITNDLPIKIFLINNSGYQSIRLTQTNIFNKHFVGIGKESGDLSFPDYRKLAEAFGYPYCTIMSNAEMGTIDKVLSHPGPIICEVFCNTKQAFEPKVATKKLPDGTLYSPPLEDMSPFLDPEELKSNMYYED